jgi:hypothetical protein
VLPSDEVVIADQPIVDYNGVQLYTLQAGQLKILAPGSTNGWYLDNLPSTGVPPLIRLRTQDQSAMLVISTVTGDMYWFYNPPGSSQYDEIQMRVTRDGATFIVDPSVLRASYGSAAEIPLLVLQSITLLPSVDPDAGLAQTPDASPTTTAE